MVRRKNFIKNKKADYFPFQTIEVIFSLVIISIIFFSIFYIAGMKFRNDRDSDKSTSVMNKFSYGEGGVILRTYLSLPVDIDAYELLPFEKSLLNKEQIAWMDKMNKPLNETFASLIREVMVNNDCWQWFGSVRKPMDFEQKNFKDEQAVVDNYFSNLMGFNTDQHPEPNAKCEQLVGKTRLFFRATCFNDDYELKLKTKNSELLIGFSSSNQARTGSSFFIAKDYYSVVGQDQTAYLDLPSGDSEEGIITINLKCAPKKGIWGGS